MVGPTSRAAGRARTGVTPLAAAVALSAIVAFSILASGCRADPPYQPTLSDLQGVETLQTQFNRDAGKTRVVLLLSPT